MKLHPASGFRNQEADAPCFNKQGFTIYECRKMGYRYLNITDKENHLEKVYSDKYFFEGGQGYPNYLDQKDILIQYGINYSKILKKHRQPGKVLDVGCAAGFILKGFEKEGWECYGIDPNKTMIEYGKNVLNLKVKKGDLETFTSDIKFDLISLIQVIGHLHDLNTSLKTLYHLLSDDGYVLVESWDMKSLPAIIMGKHWHEYSPPSVVNWFSDSSLIRLFTSHGLTFIEKGRPAKKVRLDHGISLLKQVGPSFYIKDKILHFFNKNWGTFILPYPPLDLKWYLFKKLNH